MPTQLNFPITDNCNARCLMCDVWKERSHGEMSAADVRRALADPLFAHVAHVGLSGGEPSLRRDLPELVQAVTHALPRLESVSLTTHGFHPKRWQKLLPALQEICRARGVGLRLNVSVDGIGAVHERVRGVPGGFAKTLATSRLAQKLAIPVQWQTTVSAPNVHALPEVAAAARSEGVEVVFRQASEIARLENAGSVAAVALDDDERSFLADFLESPAARDAARSPARRLFYRDLVRRLRTRAPRRAPCFYQGEGVLLTAHGELYHCSVARDRFGSALQGSALEQYRSAESRRVRRQLLAETCPGCPHDQSGAWSPWALAREVTSRTRAGRLAARGAQALGIAARGLLALARLPAARSRRVRPGPVRSALLVGAYGGEHVGDAAILGGVLRRLAAREPLKHAVVASTRPDRTRRWLRSLETPVRVDVVPYTRAGLRGALEAADALVFAGGPLMDLPDMLVRHLDLAARVRARTLPFWIEGVGVGPFRLAPSRWLAKRLARLSTSLSVRSAGAAGDPLLAGAHPEIVCDPAFDYLAGRGALTRLAPREVESLAELLAGSEGRVRVGLNLRPLWRKYGGSAADAARLEQGLLDRVAEALRILDRSAPAPLSFVCFAMNADQYGFSDLSAAHALAGRVAGDVDLRVWRMEPGVDGVLHLLRLLDAALVMRFHAAIFALSQDLPCVGIDYAASGRGKVAELFEERGLGERSCGLRDAPELLARRLLATGALAGSPEAPSGATTRASMDAGGRGAR